jgi:hypothetical protein
MPASLREMLGPKTFTLYRVDYRINMESRGFSFHSSERDAWRSIDKAVQNKTADLVEEGGSDVEAIQIVPTKAGILKALERYAKHPDNG